MSETVELLENQSKKEQTSVKKKSAICEGKEVN